MTGPNEALFPLADLASIPSPPAWFSKALAVPFKAFWVEADGIQIEARSWGDPGKPGLLLVHGSAAHLGWWSFLAPFFAEDFHIATFSLSGMGNSGWRKTYSVAGFAREIWAVADAAGITAGPVPPIVVAHSMGGLPTIHSSAVLGKPMRAAVLVDVALPGPGVEPPAYSGHRLYPTLEAALARFRLAPPQPCENRWIAEYLGRMAVKQVQGPDGQQAWTWKFDAALWNQIELGDIWGGFETMRSPLAIIRGELSQITGGPAEKVAKARAPAGTPFITIPESHHHVMVDQPMALVAALRALFAAWVK